MSKAIKENCVSLLHNLQSNFGLLSSTNKKKNPSCLDKVIRQTNSDFKFLSDELEVVWREMQSLQAKILTKNKKIIQQQKKIYLLELEAKRDNHTIKNKYQRMKRQFEFLHFMGRKSMKYFNEAEEDQQIRSRSLKMVRHNLHQLGKQINTNNTNLCVQVQKIISSFEEENFTNRAPPLWSENMEVEKSSSIFNNPDISEIFASTSPKMSPFSKQDYPLGQLSPLKTKKKVKNEISEVKNGKKRELAELIACQTKTSISKERYLSTDL